MPNWCSNKTEISGPEDQVERLLQNATVTDDHGVQEVSFAALIPMPEILIGTTSPTPTGEFDSTRYDEWVNDPENEHWTAEKVEEVRIKHYEAITKAEEALAATGYSNWWDWQLDNWGVKWGDSGSVVDALDPPRDGHVAVTVAYDTPWGPFADDFWNKISRMYPDIEFTNVYEEPGMCFSGGTRHHNGRMIASEHRQWDDVDFDLGEDEGWEKFTEYRDDLIGEILAALDSAPVPG